MRRHLTSSLAVLLGAGLMAPRVDAHHAYATFFDLCASKTIEGSIERVQWREPHVSIELRTDDGTTFLAEWTSPQALARDAVTAETLQVGDRVIVTGSPFRDPAVIRKTVPAFTGEAVDTTVSALTQIRRARDGWRWGRAAPRPSECAGK